MCIVTEDGVAEVGSEGLSGLEVCRCVLLILLAEACLVDLVGGEYQPAEVILKYLWCFANSGWLCIGVFS